jgi:hypothetical protein
MPVANPSPVVEYFVKKLSAVLPDAERAQLSSYTDAVAATTDHGDLRRAWHCAGWATQLAEEPEGSHLAHLIADLKEAHKLWEGTILGIGFGMMTPDGQDLNKDGIGPGDDVAIQWVDDAVAVATAEAEKVGWAAVPWEGLLKELLGSEHDDD